MAEVRLAVDVINGGGEVKPSVHRRNGMADKDGKGNFAHRQ
jgi:hypothetical protein